MEFWDLYFLVLVFLVNCASEFQRTSSDAQSVGYKYSAFIKGPGCDSLEPPRFPTSHDEVVAIVQEAIRRGVTVKAYGSRHSSTDIICTDGIPVDMHGLHDMSLDDSYIVTVGAGATVGDLAEFLASHGRGFPIIPAFQNITGKIKIY
jgi:FAD/FMN-containing dehydrogenase